LIVLGKILLSTCLWRKAILLFSLRYDNSILVTPRPLLQLSLPYVLLGILLVLDCGGCFTSVVAVLKANFEPMCRKAELSDYPLCSKHWMWTIDGMPIL
jgi:hypothetical protein